LIFAKVRKVFVLELLTQSPQRFFFFAENILSSQKALRATKGKYNFVTPWNFDSLDSYGMTKLFFKCESLFYFETAARLERKSFFAVTQFLIKLKSSAKKIGSGRRIKLPK